MQFIMNSGSLKSNIWINKLIGLLVKKLIVNHIPIFFLVTKHGLKNEIINLNVIFLVKP
jgi:hypothetical protein